MSLFKGILDAIGLGKDKEEAEEPKAASSSGKSVASEMAEKRKMATARSSREMPMVDVAAKLDGLAEKFTVEVNWRMSIVDLLKVLDLDSSSDARKALATELHCPADLMDDSAKMNTWLHKTVLTKISKNGGNVPKDLLD